MKKNILCILGLVLALAGFTTACEKKASPTVEGQVASVDTSGVEKKFETAPAEVKSDLDAALTSIRYGEYPKALDKLRSLSTNAKLTPEQQNTLKDLITKVQNAVTTGATKAIEGAEKAVGDVKNALPK